MGGWSNDFSGNAYEAHDTDALYPRAYECEAHDCRATDARVDDGGTMEQCQDCESYFCPAHRVMEKGGRYDVCLACRHQQEIDAVSPRFDD